MDLNQFITNFVDRIGDGVKKIGRQLADPGELNYYILDADRVSTIKKVLGRRKKVSGSEYYDGDTLYASYIYRTSEKPNVDLDTYTQNLLRSEGFVNLKGNDFDHDWGKGLRLGKASKQEGYYILLQIDYDSSGFELNFVRFRAS
jgi:hypothetical protein